jgi:hypothetical protein
MTDQTLKRKGGRPPLPPAPQNADDCRALIAAEVVRSNPRVRSLAFFYKLLRAFERAEAQTAAETKARALEGTARVRRESLELRKSDYRLRFAQKPLGVRSLLVESERLKARIRELEAALVSGVKASDVLLHRHIPSLMELGAYSPKLEEK